LAQDIAVLVNGEPISAYDIAQGTLWQNRTNNFGERMMAFLTGDESRQKCSLTTTSARPHSQAEAQQIAERIKKELIACAKRHVLFEGGATRQAVIAALIDDKLKLQEAKRLGIEITGEEVEEGLAARAAANLPPGQKPDLNAFYQQFEADGINRKTIQETIHAQLAWRALLRHTYRLRKGLERYGTYEGFSRNYLQKLRQKAIIEYRG